MTSSSSRRKPGSGKQRARAVLGPGSRRGDSTLKGRNVLITAGPTREPLDPIRFLTNASSGKMGFALARAARALGARVTVIAGPCPIPPLPGVRVVPVTTALEMHRETLKRGLRSDVVVAAAAVGDWRFAKVAPRKIKRNGASLKLELIPNPDIIGDLSRKVRWSRRRPLLAGFALETDRVLENARAKMGKKGLDLIVANGPESLGRERSSASILCARGGMRRLSNMDKTNLARAILRCIEENLPRA